MSTNCRRAAVFCKLDLRSRSDFFRALVLGLALLSAPASATTEKDSFEYLRQAMVEEQIKSRGISEREVLRAMEQVPRHLFVPEALRADAYSDQSLPLGPGRSAYAPYVVALMTSLLDLKHGDKVLEIGTGSGYHAAVLSRIASEVYSIEVSESMAIQASSRLTGLGYYNVAVQVGDGYQGWPEKAPFDAILLSVAVPEIPKPLLDQLRVGGHMVAAVGDFFQDLLVVTKTRKGLEKRTVIPVRFDRSAAQAGRSNPSVCSNVTLMQAVRIINQGCEEVGDPSRLRELDPRVDKTAIITMLRAPEFGSIHLFFANSSTELGESLDWNAIRSVQFSTLKHRPKGSIIYLFALATAAGDLDVNSTQAKARLRNIITWMKSNLDIRAGELRAAWVGRAISSFTSSDAKYLNIAPAYFRGDLQILNNSVHVVVFPCPWIIESGLDSPEDSSVAGTEHVATPPLPHMEEVVFQRLVEASSNFRADRASLAKYRVGEELHYLARDLRRVVDKAEQRVLYGIGDFTELKALHIYVEDKFNELRSDLSPYSLLSSSLPAPTALAASIEASPPSIGLQLVEEKKADSLLDRGEALLSLLVKASNKLSRTVCVISRPDKANFVLYPKKDTRNRKESSTNGLIDVYIGRYTYEVTKAGFKPLSSEFDFIDEASSVIECRLIEETSKDGPLNCRTGAQALKALCLK